MAGAYNVFGLPMGNTIDGQRPQQAQMQALQEQQQIEHIRRTGRPNPNLPITPAVQVALRQRQQQGGQGRNLSRGAMRSRERAAAREARQNTANMPPDPLVELAREYQNASQEARQANESRYRDILDEYGNMRGDIADRLMAQTENIDRRFETGLEDLNNLYGGATEEARVRYGDRADEALRMVRSGNEDITGRADERTQRAMSMLGGAGERARFDAIGRGRAAEGSINANLATRGLAGTTIGANLAAGVRRDTQADLDRINEGVRNQMLSTYGSMSGDALAAAERGVGREVGAYGQFTGDQMQALDRLTAGQLGANQQFIGSQISAAQGNLGQLNTALTGIDQNRINTMENRTDSYPDMNPLLQIASQYGQTGGGGGIIGRDTQPRRTTAMERATAGNSRGIPGGGGGMVGVTSGSGYGGFRAPGLPLPQQSGNRTRVPNYRGGQFQQLPRQYGGMRQRYTPRGPQVMSWLSQQQPPPVSTRPQGPSPQELALYGTSYAMNPMSVANRRRR